MNTRPVEMGDIVRFEIADKKDYRNGKYHGTVVWCSPSAISVAVVGHTILFLFTHDRFAAISEPQIKPTLINGFPRRDILDSNIQAELDIRNAINCVEALGSHPLLTDAATLLGQARAKVADYIDSQLQPVSELPDGARFEHNGRVCKRSYPLVRCLNENGTFNIDPRTLVKPLPSADQAKANK